MQHSRDRYACHWLKSAKERNVEEEDREKWEKDENQHYSFPLISAVYNFKAITACLCQRVWNNTLEEVRKKGRRRGGRVCGCSSPSAGTKACCCSNKYQGYWHKQQGLRAILVLFGLSQPLWYQCLRWLNVVICNVCPHYTCSIVVNMPGCHPDFICLQ